MAKYNFDTIIDRSGTDAIKVDALEERFGDKDLIPLWVADMDFLSPVEISDALVARAQHGVFGYTSVPQSYYDSIINWVRKRHDWNLNQDWVSYIPGIVKGISFAIDCFLIADNKVIIQPPVYPPFRSVPAMHSRKVVDNPLLLEAGQFKMDIEGLEQVIDPSCRMLILCNPHNPGGRVWSREELEAIAEICYDNGILVISDEIHCDLVFADHKHIPFATVSEKAAQNSITFMAPSKTFNIAGIVSSFSVIPNTLLREKFNTYLEARELNSAHLFVYPATEAAYNYGGEWLDEMKEYIWDNIALVDTYLKNNIPQIKAMIPEASFLIWLDCRELGLTQEELTALFIKDAKLALNDGITFGKEGEGYMRMNVGTSRSIIEKALDNLKKTIEAKQ